MAAGVPGRHQSLEHLVRVLLQNGGDIGAADDARIGITVTFILDLLLIQDSHHIGLFFFLFQN